MDFGAPGDAPPRGEEGGALRREQNALVECEAAAGEDIPVRSGQGRAAASERMRR